MSHELIESRGVFVTVLLALPFAAAGTLATIAGIAEVGARMLRRRTFFPAAVILLGALAPHLGAAPADRWPELYAAGFALYEQGNYEQAKAALIEALSEAEKLPPTDPARPITLHTLGTRELYLSQRADARLHLEAALAIRQHLDGVASAGAARCMSQLAGIYIVRAQPEKARRLLDQALGVMGNLGEFHAARRLVVEAELAGRESNFARAVHALRRAIYLAAAQNSDQTFMVFPVLSLAYIDLAEGRLTLAKDGNRSRIAMPEKLWGTS